MKKKNLSLEEIEKNRNRSLSPLMKAGITLVVALLIASSIFAVAASISSSKQETVNSGITKIERSLSGNSLEDDQRTVVEQFTNILEMTNPPESEEELIVRLEAINEGDLAGFDEAYLDLIYLPSIVDKDVSYQVLAHQSLLSLAAISSNFAMNDIAPVSVDAYKQVYLDEITGRAFVPISIYSADQDTPILVEFVYVDGHWLLDPYSYTSTVRFTAELQQQFSTMADESEE